MTRTEDSLDKQMAIIDQWGLSPDGWKLNRYRHLNVGLKQWRAGDPTVEWKVTDALGAVLLFGMATGPLNAQSAARAEVMADLTMRIENALDVEGLAELARDAALANADEVWAILNDDLIDGEYRSFEEIKTWLLARCERNPVPYGQLTETGNLI